ncbi:MAG: hypothetical protein IKL22_09745 [Lachnospiraceae bacterium]|nr:hypothetical protein [Lachnospiraceae bacterium]
MKKITSKQVFTYVVLLGILVFVAAYFFGYKKNVEKTEALELSNQKLDQRVKSLKKYYDEEQEYLNKMEPMTKEIDRILAQYPADIREEDIIIQAVNLQMGTPVQINNITLPASSVMKNIPENVVTGAGVETYQKPIDFVKRKTNYTTQLDYPGLKNVVQALFDSNYLISIERLTYSGSQETGILSGTLDLSFYSVRGTDKEYVAPVMIPYEPGTENIFGYVDPEEEEEGEENAQ